jgi:hypothetical protein
LVADQENKAFIPIIADEPTEEVEEDQGKINLIISNKGEYFDLLFELLNLGVTNITT